MSQYIRSYIQTFRKSFSLISPYPLIESSANGYYINHDFHIMTDLQQFDMLWEQALHAVTIPHKVELLKQAVELYKGPVFENACDEHWILSTVNHYQLRYIGLVNELLATLDKAGDYTGVQQYAARAIQLAPENTNAHYWLIHSMNHLGTLELAKNACLDEALVPAVSDLLRLKMETPEIGLGPRIDIINDYLDASIDEVDQLIQSVPSDDKVTWDELNYLFLQTIGVGS